MDATTDPLEVKIEKARSELSEDARNAIDAIDWKAAILRLRDKKGYDFEQLAELETETELVLVGLVPPQNYPRELETRMRISRSEANDLVKEMNEQVFAKIREELIKNTERRKIFDKKANANPSNLPLSGEAGSPSLTREGREGFVSPENPPETREDILQVIEKPELVKTTHPIMGQKLSATVASESIKTEHSIGNIAKAAAETEATPPAKPASLYAKGEDPYRIKPE